MVIVRQPSEGPEPAVGAAVHLAVDPEHLHVFDGDTTERLEPR